MGTSIPSSVLSVVNGDSPLAGGAVRLVAGDPVGFQAGLGAELGYPFGLTAAIRLAPRSR